MMNVRSIPLLATVLIGLFAGCADTSTPPPSTGAKPGPTSTSVTPSGPETYLKRGMTPKEVKTIMGNPIEIEPVKVQARTAEIWTYRRSTQGNVRQVQVGTHSLPIITTSSPGQTSVWQTTAEPIYKQQTEIIDETIDLLMLDGHLQKVNRAVNRHYEFQ